MTQHPGVLTSCQEGWCQLVRKLESFVGRMASEGGKGTKLSVHSQDCLIPRSYCICWCVCLVMNVVSAF